MKVAIVCDWLTNVGGAEKVLLAVHQMYPEAPIYTSQYNPRGIDWFHDAEVKTGWMKILPSKLRRLYPMIRQAYFNRLDLSDYDLVISITGAEAKSIKCGPNTTHICYCHVPTQYYWQMYDQYVENPGFGIFNPIVRPCFKKFVRPLRKADYIGAQGPDYFVTISKYASEMIKKYYDRNSVVIAPPVEIKKFRTIKRSKKRDGFINYSRQVSWKRQDLAIKACIAAGKKLTIIGDGPEHNKLIKAANGSDLITFKPAMSTEGLREELIKSEAFIFPSVEPFGIAPVEALAAGCPVVALNEGGAKDYIKPGKNGELFKEQTVDSLAKVLKKFDYTKYKREEIIESANFFDVEKFKKRLKEFIDEKMAQ